MASPSLTGQCHCGAVRFRINGHSQPRDLMRCNCSLCRRRNAIMATVDLADFELLAGADQLSLYQWNTRIAKHYFCSNCGIYTHHQRRRRPNEYGYNVSCLDDFDPDTLGEVPLVEGKSFSIVDESGN